VNKKEYVDLMVMWRIQKRMCSFLDAAQPLQERWQQSVTDSNAKMKKKQKSKHWVKNDQAIVGVAETDDREEESVDKRELAGLLGENYSTASII
jgi:hypothetical protein